MSPRTCLIPVLGALALLTACGEPPRPLPTSPPYAAPSASAGSLAPGLPASGLPVPPATGGVAFPTTTGYAPYPTYPTAAAPVPTTAAPKPTPSHAGKCTGQPTGAEILALVKGKPGMPTDPLRIFEGPFCSGTWSFTTVEVAGMDEDDVEPLMVIATGRGSTLLLVAAGSDVCTDQVFRTAPPSIRVLACGE